MCDQLCTDHADALVGAHFTNVPPGRTAPLEALTSAERDFASQLQAFREEGGGYMHLQSTKPWKPAVGSNDSPAGLAAWIVEKMQGWSD